MPRTIVVAGAYGTNGGAALGIQHAFHEALDVQPTAVRMPDLAGPNDTIQILLDSVTWLLLLKGAVGVFGAAFLKKLGERSADAVANLLKKPEESANVEVSPEKAQVLLKSLIWQTEIAKRTPNSVIFGFSLGKIHFRNIGIELNADDPWDEAVIRAIAALAVVGPWLEELARTEGGAVLSDVQSNSDCSGKIELKNDGGIVMKRTNGDILFEFDPDGRRID